MSLPRQINEQLGRVSIERFIPFCIAYGNRLTML
jgi:hypothetical protein